MPKNAARRLARIRADLTRVSETVWFYNLDNYRDKRQVARELRALAKTGAAIIALCEVIGNVLPDLEGYQLVRDTSTRSRANIAAYVRDDLPVRDERWIDLEGTWPRTKGPGIHEARSYLVMRVGRMQVIVAHQPPKNARDAVKLQAEGIVALVRAMAPKGATRTQRAVARLRPRLLVWDSNRKSGEEPGPDQLAGCIKGKVHGGHRIDNAVTRGDISVERVSKHSHVAGAHFKSDHRGAVRFRIRVRSYWLQ